MSETLFDPHGLEPLPPMPPERIRTLVRSLKGRGEAARKRVLEIKSNPSFLYVGRPMGGSYRGHILANPFRLDKDATLARRRRVVLEYRDWLNRWLDMKVDQSRGVSFEMAKAVAIQDAFKKLPGKILGCWCGDWDGVEGASFDCHAVELVRALRERGLA